MPDDRIHSVAKAELDALEQLLKEPLTDHGQVVGVCEILRCNQDANHQVGDVLICAGHLQELQRLKGIRIDRKSRRNP